MSQLELHCMMKRFIPSESIFTPSFTRGHPAISHFPALNVQLRHFLPHKMHSFMSWPFELYVVVLLALLCSERVLIICAPPASNKHILRSSFPFRGIKNYCPTEFVFQYSKRASVPSEGERASKILNN